MPKKGAKLLNIVKNLSKISKPWTLENEGHQGKDKQPVSDLVCKLSLSCVAHGHWNSTCWYGHYHITTSHS